KVHYNPAEIAAGMLRRYSSPKIALEMAQIHSHDGPEGSPRCKRWQAVAKEICKQAGLGPDGSPRRTRAFGDVRGRKDWAALFAKHNLPPAPGSPRNARWIAGQDDWWVQTETGWYWLRHGSRRWVHAPSGPP
ncbi:MAG: hypothetical protein WBY94_06265, partial [Polyangiaceae bacterium]